jgi:glycosyltransferase involved in cell wall biosynthesis
VKRLREGEQGTIWGAHWMLRQLREADCFVALNRQVSAEFVDIGVPPERIVHIPNGVDTDKAEPKTDYALGHQITVTFMGRLHAQKGLDVLLLAFQQVREELPQFSWRLRLIGAGERRAQLEAMARQLAIDGAVEFLGQVDDPWPFLSQSDIFVLPSRSEGMSNALLEAMACALPCIATDIGGNNEVIAHLGNGLLVQPDGHEDLASALALLATDRKLRERLGQEALRTVGEGYSLDSVANRYIALYTSLLQSGK